MPDKGTFFHYSGISYTTDMTTKAKNRYMLIDGNALVHRGFHAIPGLMTKSGEHTGAVYGFTSILLRAIKDLKPTHIACCFDLAGPTFRHEMYDDYKATRVKQAQELYDQFPRVKEIVKSLNIPIYEKAGFEADDLLGTLSKRICEHEKGNCEVMIVTGDMDTLQLVDSCVKVYTLKKGMTDTAIYDAKAVFGRYKLNPSQMIDYKALRGDPSDNIKGVKGIGEKTASELISEFGSIDNLYSKIRNLKSEAVSIKPRVLQLLLDGEESARQSYTLSTIVRDVKIDFDIPLYEFGQSNLSKTVDIFKKLEFRSLVDKLPKKLNSNPKELVKSPEAEKSEVDLKTKAKFTQSYKFVKTADELDSIVEANQKHEGMVLDTETMGLNAVSTKLVGVSFCFTEGVAFYAPADVVKESKKFLNLLRDEKVKKAGHNIKFDYLVLETNGIKLGGIEHDTMLISYLLNSGGRQHGLDALAFNELGYQMQPITELIGSGKNQTTMDQVDPEKVSWYASEDADITMRLLYLLEPQLKKEGVEKIYKNIEVPLIKVLARMERFGIKVNIELLNHLSKTAEKQITLLEKSIHKLAGVEFNIASPKQLKEVLFEKMKITPLAFGKKTKTGISTAADQLEKMVDLHPIIPLLLKYREITKLQSTYLLTLPTLVNPSTGRIHTSYNQTIAATGRLSSTDPNLQNIPIGGDGMGNEVRKAFVAEKGYKLLSIDYSQMELRIAAHLSKDANLKRIFEQGLDIHSQTAAEIFKVKEKDVTPEQRRHAKTINFGILYGLSAFGLSQRSEGVDPKQAKEYIDKYFDSFPQIKEYMERIKEEVRNTKRVTNELGRFRKFPEIDSSQFFIRQAAERAAINFPIQSLQADVIKVAMLNIDSKIKNSELEIRMLLQVHDELVFEVKEDKVDHYIKLIKPLMENAIKLSVPVTSEAKVGDSWGEMEVLALE